MDWLNKPQRLVCTKVSFFLLDPENRVEERRQIRLEKEGAVCMYCTINTCIASAEGLCVSYSSKAP